LRVRRSSIDPADRRALDRRIFALAVPALGALVVEPVYELTDTAVVGHLGRTPLVGLALAATVLNVVGWSAGFLTMATTSRVAFLRGRGEAGEVGAVVHAAYAVAACLGVLLGALVVIFGREAADLLGGSGEGLSAATTYLRISALGLPFLLLALAGAGHLQGLEDTRTPFLILAASNVLNLVLELLLVYGFSTGIAGSAWGTVLAQIGSAAMFVIVSARRVDAATRVAGREVRRLLRDAGPIVVRTVALGAAITGSAAIAARIGGATLAGHQITAQVWLLLALIVDALAVPAQVFVGAELGRADVSAAISVGDRCLRVGFLLSAGLTVLTCALAPVLPYLFTSDPQVRHAATVGLFLCGAQQVFAAGAFVLDGLLLGASDYRTLRRAMLLSLLGYAPFALATLLDHRLGIAGVWLALLCWLAARTALLGRRWQSRKWAALPVR
jgi:putative MATE family efflux protein